jgi:hypothetical protein
LAQLTLIDDVCMEVRRRLPGRLVAVVYLVSETRYRRGSKKQHMLRCAAPKKGKTSNCWAAVSIEKAGR